MVRSPTGTGWRLAIPWVDLYVPTEVAFHLAEGVKGLIGFPVIRQPSRRKH